MITNKSQLMFLACVDLSKNYSGIARKVLTEYNTLNKYIPSILIGYYKNGIVIYNGNKSIVIEKVKKHRRIELINCAKKYSENGIKYVYIRRFPCNPLVINFLACIKRQGCEKIVWEIPTYPYDHEHDAYKLDIYTVIVDTLDKIYRKKLKKYVNRIVTFSNRKNLFGIETINTGNGIDVESIRPRKIKSISDQIDMIAVAVLNNWHGYDRLIQGIYEYYQKGGLRKVFFHLVGDGHCLNQYKEQAKKLDVTPNVIFYGFKNKDEIDEIYDLCDVAVDSLGWHRSKVEIGTSIKTREYLAKGLPIIASTPMDIFPDGWDYAYYAPTDDTPIDIEKVIEFIDELRIKNSAKELADEIRKICKEKCDMSVTMKPIIEYLLSGR